MISNKDFNLIAALDLSPIKVKLMHKQSGEGWSLEKANAMEIEYRRFLYLMKAFPNEQTAPLVDVDTFWHYHILDTMKYARDCDQAFGYFLHHYPYVGMEGEDGAEVQQEAGQRMRDLYESTFGEDYLHAQPANDLDYGAAGTAAANNPWYGAATGVEAADVQTAWCGAPAISAAGAQTAWCGAPAGTAGTVQAAWCGAPAGKAANMATAWCGAPVSQAGKPAANAQTAWCGAPVSKAANAQTAWCGAPVSQAGKAAANAQTAWCGAP
ncbi:glycine-rich domain-containing protein-like [Massilia sp. Se16.2.3]|nr:glycine-rich domain-containing protein-like [Massilia sp. Se16.2.3]QNA99206.1 glycine-rich domain-containing protein-like [Massilia sp. Se16.2.3]